MKKTITLLLLFHLTFCGLTASTPQESELKSEQDSVDLKILQTWKSFVTAILDFDKLTLVNLSTDCIDCYSCVRNTIEKDSLFSLYQYNNPDDWYDKLNNEFCYISSPIFYNEKFPIMFNDFIKTKIADSTNWRIYDEGEQNRRMFYKDCISKNSNIDIAKIKVVSIKTFETTADYEGAAILLSFIETKDGYKFCRYNTNP